MFASRMSELPERCRLMMLLGALGGTTEVARLRAAGGSTCDLDDLKPAEDGRLVQMYANRLSFRHPLIGAAVVGACSERERRWAHGALAGVIDAPERRVRHLAESTVGPDEDIAGQLEATARILLRQGDAIGAIGAVAAFTRAADLSPQPADRGRRLAEAAYVGAEVAVRWSLPPDCWAMPAAADRWTPGRRRHHRFPSAGRRDRGRRSRVRHGEPGADRGHVLAAAGQLVGGHRGGRADRSYAGRPDGPAASSPPARLRGGVPRPGSSGSVRPLCSPTACPGCVARNSSWRR